MAPRLERLLSGLALIQRQVLALAACMFVAATLIMLTEGLNRSLRDVSFFWAEEAVRYLMIWAFFLSLGAAGRHGLHIRTEMLVDAMGPRVRWAMHGLSVAAGLGFAGLLFVASLPQLHRFFTMGMMSESNLDVPEWVIFSVMPIGTAMWFLDYLGKWRVVLAGRDPYTEQHAPPTPKA